MLNSPRMRLLPGSALLALGLLGGVGAPPAAAAVTIAWGGDVTLGSSHGLPPARGWPQLGQADFGRAGVEFATLAEPAP